MPRCFVIQPFDAGPFDKRFDDVLVPAIASAGLEPYRVDRDAEVTVPVEAIESGIREATACVADITTDNPNVWFELGFAFACGRPVVLICSSQRGTRFPFDVQHRHVITYQTESSSDFEKLTSELGLRLQAALAKEAKVQSLSPATLRETEGLEPHEIAALVIIAESDLDPESYPSASGIKHDMGNAGYTEIAAVIAVNALRAKKFVNSVQVQPYNGDSYTGYHLLDGGREWLASNLHRLALTKSQSTLRSKRNPAKLSSDFPDFSGFEDDSDLPF